MSIINEAYFGKTKGVLEIEKAISELRKKYKPSKDDKKNGWTEENLKPIVESKLFGKFLNAIRDEFGFKEVFGGIDPVSYMNAYTYPIREENYGLYSDRFESSGTGIRFKKELKAETLIVITAPLLFNRFLSNAELTAVLLHEVGHSFRQAVIPVETCIDILKDSVGMVVLNILTATKHTLSELLKRPAETILNLKAVIDSSPEVKARVKKRWPGIFERIWRAQSNYSPPSMYIDEKFADHFASMYGYGAELDSALIKIDYDIKNRPNSPISNSINIIAGAVELAMDLVFDCHPILGARLKSTVNILEDEINRNPHLPVSKKREIQKQLKDINLLAVQYQNLENSSNYSLAKKLYFKFVYNNLKDGDFVSRFLVGAYNLDLVDQKIQNAKK